MWADIILILLPIIGLILKAYPFFDNYEKGNLIILKEFMKDVNKFSEESLLKVLLGRTLYEELPIETKNMYFSGINDIKKYFIHKEENKHIVMYSNGDIFLFKECIPGFVNRNDKVYELPHSTFYTYFLSKKFKKLIYNKAGII